MNGRTQRPISLILMVVVPVLLLMACSQESQPTKTSLDEKDVVVLYLDHPPVQGILDDVKKVMDRHQIDAHFFTMDSEEGKQIAEERDLQGHTPIAIWINGTMEHEVNGKTVTFYSFPEGSGSFMVENGQWTIDDLDQVLSEISGDAK
ncbi:hypothetical protein [Desmospora profundinema]|uniref:Uncharacterized protein n=1 Tax=Desmospora profundinema TaxID=1571184 RepID=A0ABU1IMR1_9BACL|nr:hypothetical protein [Desmospora profundinema]MDR6225981.1 hypothetical protein [Desmospora profundinema]